MAAAALAATALVAGYAVARACSSLLGGDSGDAARWATLTFVAGVPYAAFYALRTGLRLPRPPLAAAGIVAIAIAFQALLASGSYFTGDDWLHIVLAHDAAHGGGLDLDYLGRAVFIHYAPGLRLGYWALAKVAPLDWGVALAGLLVMFAGSLFLLHRICTRLYGERRSNLVLVLACGTSILFITSFLWFADGLHKLPSTFLSLLAVDAYLSYRLRGSRAALALSVAAVSLGSLFYVKALLVPLYLVMIRLLFLDERPGRALRILWRERWSWLAYAPTIAIYLWNYQQSYAHARGSARPSLDLIGDYLWIAWFQGVTPAFAGIEVGPHPARSAALFAVVAQLALVAVVAVSVRLKRSAWRAWLFWGVAFAANATLVGLGRLGSLGLDRVGSELRYDTEMAWLLPLALGFAFYPGTVAARAVATEQRRRAARPAARAAAIGALCAYAVAATATGAGISQGWRDRNSGPPERYVENLRRDVERIDRSGRAPVAIDDQVPAFLIGSSARPWNRLERLVPAIEPRLRVVVADASPLQVGDDGHVGPAVLQPLTSGARALAGTGTLRLASGRIRPQGPCLEGGGLRFEPKPAFRGQSLYALVSYDVERGAPGRGRIATPAPAGDGAISLDGRGGDQLVNLGRPLRLGLPRRSRLCLRSIAVGWLGANGR